jgi:hypothetical protein
MRGTLTARPSIALRRVSALGLVPMALLLASCGDDAADSSDTLEEIQATSYVVREPATTTTTIPLDSIPEGGRHQPPDQRRRRRVDPAGRPGARRLDGEQR